MDDLRDSAVTPLREQGQQRTPFDESGQAQPKAYQDLIAFAQARERLDDNDQGMRNRVSALVQYLDHQGMGPDSPIGPELGADFDRCLVVFVADKKKVGRKDASIANVRSYLRKWQQLSAEMFEVEARPRFANLSDAVRYYIERPGKTTGGASEKFNLSALERKCGLKAAYLRDILNRKRVRKTSSISVDSAVALEEVLNAPLNTFSSFIRAPHPGLTKLGQTTKQTDFGKLISKLQRDEYRLKIKDLPEQLKSELIDFIAFKTAPSTLPLVRNENWKERPNAAFNLGDKALLDLISLDGSTYPSSACKFVTDICSFFGCMAKNGFDPQKFSLIWLCDLSLLGKYLKFSKLRLGATTEGAVCMYRWAKTLLYSKGGWLYQQPEFATRMAEAVPSGAWSDWCNSRYQALTDENKRLKKDKAIKTGRKVEDPIKAVLQRDHPITALLELIDGMEHYMLKHESNPMVISSLTAATMKRDILIFKIGVPQPLRLKMFQIMTYRDDNTGNLYKMDKGLWAIRFNPEDFKNEVGAACDKAYDVPLPADITAGIESYLKSVRPLFKPTDDRVFLAESNRHLQSEHGGRWLSQMLRRRSRQFIPGCPGFGPHALRHIVATDYIKNNPGSFMIAAHILHDRLETVMKAYAHLKAADGHKVYQEYLKEIGRAWKDGR